MTPSNFHRIRVGILPQDRREAIRAGIVTSHYALTRWQNQRGYVLISHTEERAGILCEGERLEWGTWSEEAGTCTAPSGRIDSRKGRKYAIRGTETDVGRIPRAASCSAKRETPLVLPCSQPRVVVSPTRGCVVYKL